MPILAKYSAEITAGCDAANEVRTMNGDDLGIVEVAAPMLISGTFACVASGATASEIGVNPMPARKLTLSLTINSWAMRLLASGTPPSSRTMSSIFLAATVSPLCWM
jgi:hypothetical protein